MEKPSSTRYDSSSRLLDTSKDDTEQKERYYDRMTIRGIPVLRDTEEVESAPVWRGDHTFSSDAASYSLAHFIEPEVAREHPTWSQQQVTEVATHRFEQRLSQDLSYEHKESAHEESVVHWLPIRNKEGAWELATKYGDTMVTLQELWEHTREYAEFAGNPEAYNPEEHRAQIQMQEELISGAANGFVSVLSHPDAIRYVQMWQKTDDGSIISKQVDLYKTTGRDFSHEEGARLIDHLAAYFKEDVGGGEASVVSYAHMYIHEKKVAEDDIRTIALAQTMETQEFSVPSPERSIPMAVVRIGNIAARDTAESMVQLGAFLREHIDKKIADFKKRDPDVKKKASDVFQASDELMVHKQTEKKSALYRAFPDMQKPRVETVRITDTMKSVAAEWWIINSMMQHKDTVPVAPTAIMYWLMDSARAHSLELHADRIIPTYGEKGGQTELTRMQRIGASIRGVFSFMVGNLEMKKSADHHEKIHRRLKRNVVEQSPIHKDILREVPIKQEEPVVILSKSTVETLFIILQKLLVEGHLKIARSESVQKDDILVQRMISGAESKPEELSVTHISRQLSIAVIIWWLTEYSKSASQKNLFVDREKKVSDTLIEGADTEENRTLQWLLLSIIWYLTALREHGKQGLMQKKPVSKKKKKQQVVKPAASLPPSGIIFTFGS